LQVTLRRGAKALLESTDLTIHAGERIGLIGANGSGKSSLFALLRGELHADKGDVELPAHWRIAHVAQETPALERPAVEYAIDGDSALRDLQRELERTHDGTRMGELHAALGDADVYTARPRAEALLLGLGFKREELERPVSSFSGGWRMRLNLAQALMCRSDLLLLDEPTNHLDLDAIIWLEDWLRRYPGTLMVISHDRDFLDGVVKAIVHIDQRKLRRYTGDYSSFETQRAQAVVLAAAQLEKQARERAHLQSFIDRFRAKATKARQAQSRMKMLAKMEDLAPLHVAAPFSFEFRDPERSPDPLLVLEDVEAGYPDKRVLSGVQLSLRANERIGLLGVNGAGKSTLVKTIAGVLPVLGGSATFNKGLEIGYFAQHQVEMLRDDESPLWHLRRLAPLAREQDLRNYLGGFNFPGDMATDPCGNFAQTREAAEASRCAQAQAGEQETARGAHQAAGRNHEPPERAEGVHRGTARRSGAVPGPGSAESAAPRPSLCRPGDRAGRERVAAEASRARATVKQKARLRGLFTYFFLPFFAFLRFATCSLP
jgi:ATP-binding cassette subfamily F protein 3